MTMKVLAATLVAAALTWACSSRNEQRETPIVGGVICLASFMPGMLIEVHDAVTGAPAACEADGRAQDGSRVEVLDGGGQCASAPAAIYLQGVGQTGTYTVTIDKVGYQAWVKQGVVVTSGPCGLNTVMLRADLSPL